MIEDRDPAEAEIESDRTITESPEVFQRCGDFEARNIVLQVDRADTGPVDRQAREGAEVPAGRFVVDQRDDGRDDLVDRQGPPLHADPERRPAVLETKLAWVGEDEVGA